MLEFGGLGEHLEGGDVGLLGEGHLVASEGGEVVEERFEAVGWVACGGGSGGGLLFGLRGALGFRYRVGGVVGGLFVGETQWRPCSAEVPDEVGGEGADEYVGADSLLEAVKIGRASGRERV